MKQGRNTGEMKIFIDDLEQRLDELSYCIEPLIALISCSEKLSSKAGEIFASNGFACVRVVKGSIDDFLK